MQGWVHCILYVLFENAMGIVKLGAVIAGKPYILYSLVDAYQDVVRHECNCMCSRLELKAQQSGIR